MPSTLKHKFETLPATGVVIEDKGFVYNVVSARPHKNKLGEESMVVTMQGTCAEAGCKFDFKVGRSVYNLPRRCPAHNKGWSKARPWGGVAAPTDAEVIHAASGREDVRRFVRKVVRDLGEVTHDADEVADLLWRIFADTYNDAEMLADLEARAMHYEDAEDRAQKENARKSLNTIIAERNTIAEAYRALQGAPLELHNLARAEGGFTGQTPTPDGLATFWSEGGALKRTNVANEDTRAKTAVWRYIENRWREIQEHVLLFLD